MAKENSKDRLLQGQYCIVSGGAGGIGSAIADALLRDGAHVTIADLGEEKLEAARDRLKEALAVGGGELRTCVCNAMDEEQLASAVRSATDENDRLHIAVSGVGGGGGSPLALSDRESFEKSLLLNVMPAFLLLKHATPRMKERGGAFLAISSISAVMTAPLMGAYSAGKAALDALIRIAAEELGGFGIRVNAVRPGFTQTPATQRAFDIPDYVEAYLREQALKRVGQPTDIAAAVRFLVGPDSTWLTGQCLNVDGGISLHRVPHREGAAVSAMPEEWRQFIW